MKNTRLLFLSLILIISGSFLSGCTGGAGIAASWPGLFVDSDNETVYMASGSHVYAVNLTNGTEKWRFPEKADAKISFFANPALTPEGQIIVGGYDHILYSLNPQNGQPTWTFPDANDKYVGPALAGELGIFAPNTNNSLYSVGSNGSLNWKFSAEHAIWAKPLTDGKTLYIASMDHYVYALDPKTGSQVWKTEDLGGAIVGSFVYDSDGVLYVGTLGGKFSAVNVQNGEIIWQTPLKSWIWAKPVVSDGVIYLGDQDGIFYALESKTGAVSWQIQPDLSKTRAIISSPILVENTLYFASQAGILYAIDAAKGNTLWSKTIGGKIYSDLSSTADMILIAPSDFDSALVAVDFQGNNRWAFVPAK